MDVLVSGSDAGSHIVPFHDVMKESRIAYLACIRV